MKVLAIPPGMGDGGAREYNFGHYRRSRTSKKLAVRISIINFKGGVGKTTLAFNLSAGLARYHRSRVLLVDMDHQSSLSIVCLGTDGWNDVADRGATVASIFRNFLKENLPDDSIVSPTGFGEHESYSERVQIAPANLDLDDIEIELTASHQGNAIQSEWNKRTLMCRWLEETSLDEQYDYILFDCAPATKIVTQNAIAASHGYIIPVVPESVMERGAPHLHNMVQSSIDQRLQALEKMGVSRSMFVRDTQLVGLVVTRIQVARNGYTIDHTQHLNSLRRRWKRKLVEPYIKQGAGIGEAMTERVPVFDRSDTQNIGKREIHLQFKKLVNTLKDRMDEL